MIFPLKKWIPVFLIILAHLGGCFPNRHTPRYTNTIGMNAFYIGEKEVTVGQWRKFIEDTSYKWDKWSLLEKYAPSDNSPIIFTTWDDTQAFCRWLSKKEEKTYRLPTEAEWEKAARGGLEGKKYPWGNETPDGTRCNFADKNTDFYWSDERVDDGYVFTAPVGSFPPNGYGLYDVAGNAWEWCQDWYSPMFLVTFVDFV